MWNKIFDVMVDRPILGYILFLVACFLIMVCFVFSTIFVSCIFPDHSSTLEDVKDAQYVIYTSGGEMKAVKYNTIIDMETGYQYRIFEINGQHVCAPAIDADGTVYKTIE